MSARRWLGSAEERGVRGGLRGQSLADSRCVVSGLGSADSPFWSRSFG